MMKFSAFEQAKENANQSKNKKQYEVDLKEHVELYNTSKKLIKVNNMSQNINHEAQDFNVLSIQNRAPSQ
jgi:hypothetical protein